jgi:restriction system protein
VPIPDYQSLLLPVLQVSADGKEHSTIELRDRIATQLGLTFEDLAEKLPSGKMPLFTNRVAWAVVYLTKALALDRVKRGVVRITARGKDLLALDRALTNKDLSVYPEFVAFQKGAHRPNHVSGEEKPDGTETPEERLVSAHTVLRDALAADILEATKKATPSFFEELVIDLLVAMGYGGSVEDAGKAIGRAGDGGIDGIIKEDKLGLDFVYVQAKRWANSVGRPVVQAFAGSLDGVRARKGVLITTSFFTQDALEYAQKIEKRIVLMDGKQLADLMIDNNIGVNVVQKYEVKRLDSDYFES